MPRHLALFAPLAATLISAAPTSTLIDRSTQFGVLADGSSYQSGDITANFRWQASGLLTIGCSESVGIQDCYTMSLSASGDLESTKTASKLRSKRATYVPWADTARLQPFSDWTSYEDLAAHDDDDLESYTSPWSAIEEMYLRSPAMMIRRDTGLSRRQLTKAACGGGSGGGGSGGGGNGGGGSGAPKPPPAPRQRIEMFSWPGHRAGEQWRFSWKSHQGSTSITSKFFHTWQLLRRDCGGGPVITLDLKGGKAVISDGVRGCVDCSSVDASLFISHTIQHDLTVTFGIDGSISYKAFDVTPSGNNGGFVPFSNQNPVLTYEAYGDMGDQSSLKFGQYRAVTNEAQDATAFVGDYSAQRIS